MMCIYFNNDHTKFHPDPIWNDKALGFLKSISQREEQVVTWDQFLSQKF